VKATWNSFEIPSGLKRFLLRYPDTKRAIVVSENQHGESQEKNCQISFVRLEAFALDPHLGM